MKDKEFKVIGGFTVAETYETIIKAKNKELDHKTYAKECEHYLKTGDWISNFYGMYQENKIIWKSQLR